MESLPIYLFAAFAIIGIFLSQIARKRAEIRNQEMEQLAKGFGFEFLPEGMSPKEPPNLFKSFQLAFEPTPDNSFVQRFTGFHPFGIGDSPDVSNLICGQRDGIDWFLFDYSYQTTTTDGKTTQRHTHPFSIVAARVPLSLPGLTLTPETIFHRIGNKLGVHELTFELEEFNRRYFIQSSDQRLAHDLLHPKAIEYLMAQPVRQWQFGGMYVVLSTPGSITPLEFSHKLTEIQEFMKLIPNYVIQDRGFTPSWKSPLD